jgi:hypothetical protein
MKKMIFILLFVGMGVVPEATAQTKGKKAAKPQNIKQRSTAHHTSSHTTTSDKVTVTSGSSHAAFGAPPTRRFSIADPTINALKDQAAGNTPVVSPSGVVGMPKRAYGFSNGKILLRSTTAPSSGTMYGSGAVGTGTTILGIGTGENAIGVNGKNPYAGPNLWGSQVPFRNRPVADSGGRRQ